MEKGSPAKARGGSWLGQMYIIKRINTERYPSTSQPQSPDARQVFLDNLSSLPLSVFQPRRGIRLDIYHVNYADSAVITLKVAQLH